MVTSVDTPCALTIKTCAVLGARIAGHQYPRQAGVRGHFHNLG